MTSQRDERELARFEAAQNAACEAYFDARPGVDTPICRKIFAAGFSRGAMGHQIIAAEKESSAAFVGVSD